MPFFTFRAKQVKHLNIQPDTTHACCYPVIMCSLIFRNVFLYIFDWHTVVLYIHNLLLIMCHKQSYLLAYWYNYIFLLPYWYTCTIIPQSPRQAPPVTDGIYRYALDILAFTGGACPREYGIFLYYNLPERYSKVQSLIVLSKSFGHEHTCTCRCNLITNLLLKTVFHVCSVFLFAHRTCTRT